MYHPNFQDNSKFLPKYIYQSNVIRLEKYIRRILLKLFESTFLQIENIIINNATKIEG